jgi:hypothetical protein
VSSNNLSKPLPSIVLLLFLISISNQAAAVDYFQLTDFSSDFLFGTWSDNGSVSVSQSQCIASASTAHPNGNGGAPFPYSVKVSNLNDPGGYFLYLDGNSSNTGNSRIEVIIKHRELFDSSGFEQLQPDTYDTHAHDGQFKNCVSMGDNSELDISMLSTELSQVVTGSYSGSFRLTGLGGMSGALEINSDFSITITVNGSLVKITSVDNITLGTYAQSGNVIANERFCVYSQTGNYALTVSSTNQDSSGNFNLLNTASSALLPYSLSFIDSGSGQGTSAVSNLALSGSGDSSSETCGGTNNATLTLAIDEQDLQASETGSYSDTINLLVEPE